MSGDCQKKQEIKNTAKKSTSPENVNKKERNFAKQTFFGNALAIHENVVDTKKEEVNMGYEILATPFGKLEITAEPWLETRTMTFEKNALTILGENVSRLTYKLCQITWPIDIARPFEKYLLGEPHSFVRENIPEMADRVNRVKTFLAFGGFQITLSHLAATWVLEATPSYKYGNKESFEFKFAGEITKDNTWVIQVDSGEDMMVKAIECACLAIENIHEEEKFVNIMNLIYG